MASHAERHGALRWRAVFRHELRRLLSSRAWWTMLMLLCPLAGYGYVEAVRLFGEASRTALQHPELARGMVPQDGILVPTLGAFYLGTTLLFPFVAIRALGQDRESGAIKLALQWPLSAPAQVAAKLLAVMTAWAMTLVVPLSAIVLWRVGGGHLAWAETANLFFGHALYAGVVAGVALFAAAVTESAATAAIVTLAFTLGFWVLDFAAGTGPPWLKLVGELSPTQGLKLFERGVLGWTQCVALLLPGLGLSLLAARLLPTGLHPRQRWQRGVAGTVLLCAALAVTAWGVPPTGTSVDLSDDRRNSFNPADEAALARMDRGLIVTLHLNPEDSRAREFVGNVLGKLKRLVPGLKVRWVETGKAGLFDAAGDDGYGRIVYAYAGRSAESRSTSPSEILPLLHELAGAQVSPMTSNPYPGHPQVADTRLAEIWFYGLLPALILLAGWLHVRTGRVPSHLRNPNTGDLR
ncbi:MAG TPA: ABC transporter permease subunit [Rubrivivax sp.]|nr:ABC transporter permease subunit [Rubrivivax sp.]